jgi:hypothetical protein
MSFRNGWLSVFTFFSLQRFAYRLSGVRDFAA